MEEKLKFHWKNVYKKFSFFKRIYPNSFRPSIQNDLFSELLLIHYSKFFLQKGKETLKKQREEIFS